MIIELQEGQFPQIQQRNELAVIAITKHGVELARRIQKLMPNTDIYYMSKFAQGDEEERSIQLFTGSVRLLFPALWPVYQGIVCVVSLGALIRMIAPLLRDKKTDPGVVVLDDLGENVISVLSGHLGGANELARQIAADIGARPIVTTASDVQKTIPVDLLGRRFGWVWESDDKLTPVSASVVNGERVAFIQESGEPNWWMHDTPMPANIELYDTVMNALEAQVQGALIITHRQLTPEEEPILANGVLYRPKVLVLGMGCNRGTSYEEIETVIKETLSELGLSIRSVKAVCSIDLKKDEAGLLQVCQQYKWEFITYTADQLNEMNIEEPSETVYRYTGAYAVSEPAAKRYAKTDKLLLTKKKSGNVTISVGLLTFDPLGGASIG
ncbi:cobalt-precorrin 5A hydrolase [Brevibacillus ginsengisoli]|uniref:cobalt-precorrin 5A hydrolase n=1 Tax=Brevibacillus ginsengisoli TaxID=363854 RepID=UPI003CFB72FB